MGGAIHCRLDCFPKIIQNVFLENNAGNDGGAIYCCQGSSPEISQNVIARNTADKAGGAIYCYDFASPVIVSNTLDRNASNQWGGSITCHTSSSPQILNTIISNESSGYGIHAETGSYPAVTYCDVWNNPKGDYSGCEPGDGCMSKDPMFCDPEGDNYWLHIVSLCLGAGEGGTDIGAYGLGCGSGDANGDGKVGISDAVYLVNYLFRNGPPPDPVENGDVNCDDRVSVEDVIYLINYLFKGGSPPC